MGVRKWAPRKREDECVRARCWKVYLNRWGEMGGGYHVLLVKGGSPKWSRALPSRLSQSRQASTDFPPATP